MEKLKKNFAAKLFAYILMITCVVVLTFSLVIIANNLANEWYSVGENAVKKDIYNQTAESAEASILEAIYSLEDENSEIFYEVTTIEEGDGTDPIEKEISYDEQQLLKSLDGELLTGELSAQEFGYSIYPYKEDGDSYSVDRNHPLRQVNAALAKDKGTIIKGSDHGVFRIELYLGNLSVEQIPDHIVPVYKYGSLAYNWRYLAIVMAAASFLAALFLLVFLVMAIGENNRREQDNQKRDFAIKAIPLDLTAGVVAGVCVLTLEAGIFNIQQDYNFDLLLTGIAIIVAIVSVMASGFILLMAARVKLGRWWQSTVVYQCIRLIRLILKKLLELIQTIPLVWKTSLILAGCLIINFCLSMALSDYMWCDGFAVVVLLWVVCAVLFSYAVLRIAVMLKKLKEGGRHLAAGELDYKIDEKGLFFDFKEHADNLNSIGKGMENAVALKLQSERFKNELITNVSHDLKTPLTSIINYVDLLKKENLDNEKALEYIEVLDRQSQRLKKLTEDVVEASKAATGNVKMEMLPCQVGVLMTQIMGEYSEKAQEKDLNLIIKLPDDDLQIMADGRSMWRVFNNLLSNICKYSQPGTRVYQTLEKKDGKAVLTYKNTSQYELNISEEELMERFVRGDRSRHTEGSGLGLSIARNLVELQGGTFDIHIDGDLFKVVLEFPLR